MAESRATPTPPSTPDRAGTGRTRSVVTLSISISLLLIAPLWLQIAAPSERKAMLETAQKPALPKIGTMLNSPPADAPPPIKGEILVRVEPDLAQKLYRELAEATRPYGEPALPLARLIGARLAPTPVYEVAPGWREAFQAYGLWAADAIDPEAGMWRLKFDPATNPLEAMAALQNQPGLRYAEANYPIKAYSREPNDQLYNASQPALRLMRAPDAWDITTGTSNVTIAILDTGLAYGHPDLRNKINTKDGRNFVAEPANDYAWDDNSHGTYVAGIAAADSNNGLGMTGVAWGARLLSVKVLDYNRQGSIATLAMGLSYVASLPVQVVNMSTGGTVRSLLLEETAQKAFDRGLVLVAASGNSGQQEYSYPAAFDSVIAVGATDDGDRPASFSTYGQYVSLAAPGVNVLGLSWATDLDYAYSTGTSASCPFVAGTVALMLSANPQLTNIQIRNILEGTADAPQILPGTPATTPSDRSRPTAPPTVPPVAQSGAISGNSLGATYSLQAGWGRLNIYQAVLAARNGNIYPSRHSTLLGVVSGLADPQEATLRLEPGDTRYPAKDGRFQFANLPPGSYKLYVEARKYGLQKVSDFVVQGQDAQTIILTYDFSSEVAQALAGGGAVGAFKSRATPSPDPDARFFPETGHRLSGGFKEFWEAKGGLPIFGFPLSEEFQENGLTVQYFERAVLEYHTEYANTRFEVQPRLLGSQLAAGRPETAFKRLADPGATPKLPGNFFLTAYYDSTGHSLSGPFRSFWEANGGLDLFGYPISEPFFVRGADGKQRQVQYFQRCRMDYFPELDNTPYNIQLGLLAREYAQSNGLIGKN